MMVNLDR